MKQSTRDLLGAFRVLNGLHGDRSARAEALWSWYTDGKGRSLSRKVLVAYLNPDQEAKERAVNEMLEEASQKL